MTDETRQLSAAELTERVRRIWADVLHAPGGRSDATFFDLQGQSISAVRIAARIEDETGVEVDVALLFEDPDLDTFVRQVLAGAGRGPARGGAGADGTEQVERGGRDAAQW